MYIRLRGKKTIFVFGIIMCIFTANVYERFQSFTQLWNTTLQKGMLATGQQLQERAATAAYKAGQAAVSGTLPDPALAQELRVFTHPEAGYQFSYPANLVVTSITDPINYSQFADYVDIRNPSNLTATSPILKISSASDVYSWTDNDKMTPRDLLTKLTLSTEVPDQIQEITLAGKLAYQVSGYDSSSGGAFRKIALEGKNSISLVSITCVITNATDEEYCNSMLRSFAFGDAPIDPVLLARYQGLLDVEALKRTTIGGGDLFGDSFKSENGIASLHDFSPFQELVFARHYGFRRLGRQANLSVDIGYASTPKLIASVFAKYVDEFNGLGSNSIVREAGKVDNGYILVGEKTNIALLRQGNFLIKAEENNYDDNKPLDTAEDFRQLVQAVGQNLKAD
jgi:hypothetical protein